MSIYNKIKWILGILIIFVLIITTNLIDKSNFTRIKNTVTNIYEDRLIAKDLIFKVSKVITEKNIAYILKEESYFKSKNSILNENLDSYLIRFEETNLTKEEKKLFIALKNKIKNLIVIENKTDENFLKNSNSNYLNEINKINNILTELSIIQVNEGSRQVAISEKALSTIELFTQMEIYFLIFLAIIVQIIVVYNNPK
ncbi:chemotaxis protein [Polaribacter reichenbachii]|uniref:Chemotaxis protein n=2 Tax=Polaribacter reichenbachii TaxID=996801 RepID=A0A1B8U1M8_9FLAO|nr:chemotaxis protein [Polaribacter reichenbachii]APZ47260.1 chemotaxis protein [Polaribacter reichenbachii]OBY65776.1 chemotaxis protein [Polaribacter reichenbachii]